MIYVLNHYTRDCSKIVAALEAEGYPIKVFTDHTSYGQDRNNPLRYLGQVTNYLNILKDGTSDQWKIIFQDDLTFTRGVIDKILYVLARAPRSYISFYNPVNKGYREARARGHHVLSTYNNIWPQCHAVPSDLALEIARWGERHSSPLGSRGDDAIIGAWATVTKTPIFSVIPSLTQHEGYEESVFRTPGKVGRYFRYSETYEPDFDVRAVDWEAEFSAPYDNRDKKAKLYNFAL